MNESSHRRANAEKQVALRHRRTFSPLIAVLLLAVLFSTSTAIYFFTQNKKLQRQGISTKTFPFEKVVQSHQFRSGKTASDFGKKTWFVSAEDQGEAVYIADTNLSVSSLNKIFSVTDPAFVFGDLVLPGRNYIIVPILGADQANIAILTTDGEIISTSLRNSNELLKTWNIFFEEMQGNALLVKLSKLDETHGILEGTALIDMKTGKVIPGTFKIQGPEQRK